MHQGCSIAVAVHQKQERGHSSVVANNTLHYRPLPLVIYAVTLFNLVDANGMKISSIYFHIQINELSNLNNLRGTYIVFQEQRDILFTVVVPPSSDRANTFDYNFTVTV